MLEELPIAGTEIVETRLSIGGPQEAQPRALTMTGMEPLTFPALAGQPLFLELAEGVLLAAIEQLGKAIAQDIPQAVLGEDKMVAAVDVAIVLHHGCMSTLACQRAEAWLHATPACQRCIKHLNENLPHIVTHPFVEDSAEKRPPLGRSDAEGSKGTILVEHLRQMAAIAMLQDAFHHRRELQVSAMERVAEETIELQGMIHIAAVDGGHRIPLHSVSLHQVDAVHHALPGRSPLTICAIRIVHLLGSIDTDSHQPSLVTKETAPLVVEQQSVGLQGVADASAPPIILLKAKGLPVEAERAHQRFSSVPREEHVRQAVGLDVGTDVSLEHLVGHLVARALLVEVLLLQIIAISAAQVATCPCRLGHYIKWACKGIKRGHREWEKRLEEVLAEVVDRIPDGDPAYHQNGEEDEQNVAIMHADGISLDDEAACAVAHRDDTKLLLYPAQKQAEKDAQKGSCRTNHPAFEDEDAADVIVVGSHRMKGFHIGLLVDHQHGERADNVEARHKQDEGEEEIGDELLDAHDAEDVFLLFVAVLHQEPLAQQLLDFLLGPFHFGAFRKLQLHAGDAALLIEKTLREAQAGEDVVGVVLALLDHEDHARTVELVVIEGAQRIDQVHPFASLGRIDLERVLEKGSNPQATGQLDAHHAVFQDIRMKHEGAIAIKQLAQLGLRSETVIDSLDGNDVLMVIAHHESLILQDRRVDVYQRGCLELLQHRIVSLDGTAFRQRDSQLRVEGCEQAGHQVLESIEDAQRANQSHRGNRHSHNGNGADDVDGMMALAAEEVSAGYEERIIHKAIQGERKVSTSLAIHRCAQHNPASRRQRTSAQE